MSRTREDTTRPCQPPDGPGSQRLWQMAKEARVSDGLITAESQFPVSETIDRLAAAATTAGLLVFARIDHQKGGRYGKPGLGDDTPDPGTTPDLGEAP